MTLKEEIAEICNKYLGKMAEIQGKKIAPYCDLMPAEILSLIQKRAEECLPKEDDYEPCELCGNKNSKTLPTDCQGYGQRYVRKNSVNQILCQIRTNLKELLTP